MCMSDFVAEQFLRFQESPIKIDGTCSWMPRDISNMAAEWTDFERDCVQSMAREYP